MAKTGLVGLLDSVETGYACGSDAAHLSMFGHTPFIYYKYLFTHIKLYLEAEELLKQKELGY
jgi:2,3-bisphosphoglycerate-independent phosphoglycerate mutase